MDRTVLFQDMQPLGAMPPTRLKIKVKGDVRPEKAESLPASDVATATPEGTPPVETKTAPAPAHQAQPVVQEAAAAKQEPVKEEAGKAKLERHTENYDPMSPSLYTASTTPQVRSPAIQQNGTPTPGHSRNPSASSKIIMPSPQRAQALANQTRDAKMAKVVKKAIEMAKSSGQEKLAAVISKFYEETFNNAPLAALFDAVITKTETEAQKAQFQKEMKRIRKLVKRESTSRSRSMSGAAASPTMGYSAANTAIPQPPPTMGSATMGSQPLNFRPSHTNPRPSFAPLIPLTSTSPFTAFRGVLQPSPFSPTHSHPASPTYPPNPNAAFAQGRSGIAPPHHPAQQHSPPPPAVQHNLPTPQASHTQPAPQLPAISTPQPQPQNSTMVSTRRSARATGSDLAASASDASANATASANAQATPTPGQSVDSDRTQHASITVADPAPATNGVTKDAIEKTEALPTKSVSKLATKSPKSGKGKRSRRSPSVDSLSSLSSVDEVVVEKGAPPPNAKELADSQVPSRAVSRSATPRPGAGPKAKVKKGSNLKNLAGTKRGASETIAIEEADEETRERRTRARANFDKELRDRKAEEPPEPDFTSYRESEEYLSALPEPSEARPRRGGRRQSAPDTSKVTSTRTSTSAATPAPPAFPETGGRRARQSTQNQRLQIDVVASAPRLEIHTPSTPVEPPSDAESNGDPPPKRRKTARTKYSPVKLPNGNAPARKGSPSRSSPPLDGGREGKKPNRDQCYACGCGGDLICCDMCQNSFHAECWDPPCTDASDEPFQGFEWICTHCRIYDKRKENDERSKKGEPLLIDTSDEESDMEVDDDVPTTPPDWTLVDAPPLEVPLFKQLGKSFKEMLPEQFGLKPMIRDAYDGYVVDTERRYRPTQRAPITVYVLPMQER
jgi:hypothetical protein